MLGAVLYCLHYTLFVGDQSTLPQFPQTHPFSSTKKNKSGMNKRQESNLGLNLGAAKSLDRRSHSHGSRSGDSPGTSSDDLSALLALPNTHARSLDGVLTAESASIATRQLDSSHVRAVLGDLNLLDNLTQRRTISRSVLSANSNLLSSLTLQTP